MNFNGIQWKVSHTYDDFLYLRYLIISEINESINILFPEKSFLESNIKLINKKSLLLLEYISYILQVGGYDCLNIIDSVSSFLEVAYVY